MKTEITRRRFVKTLGATASATLLNPLFLDLDTAWAQAAKPYVRKNVKGMKDNDPILITYNKAIMKMKALVGTDKRSWAYQVAIHTNECHHYDSWFLPWHRMYLYWFEQIVRKISGDNSWALPYWDWQNDQFLPKPFQDGGTLTDLYVKGRNKFLNDGSGTVTSLPPGVVGPPFIAEFERGVAGANSNKIFDPAVSPDFSDLLEQGPHDLLHNRVGSNPTTDGSTGLMATYMAAEDPIFFLHHANIDRLWCRWLSLKNGRKDPLGNKAWGRDKKFTFVDEDGKDKDMQVSCEYVYPMVQRNYVYEGDPPQVPEKCTVDYPLSCMATEEVLIYEAIQSPPAPFVLPETSDPVYFTFTLDSLFREKVINILNDPTKTIYLKLYDIRTPTQPGVAWDIFVGPGSGPSLTGPFFVGAMALFIGGVQDEQNGHVMLGEYTCAINSALQDWLQNELNVKINVTFLPAGVVVDGQQSHLPPVSEVTIGHAQLIVQTVICS